MDVSVREEAVTSAVNVATHPHLATVVRAWRAQVATDPGGLVRALVLLDFYKFNAESQLRHLRIRVIDGSIITAHAYQVLQAIKRRTVGDIRMVEVYPQTAEEVDKSHTYHLWEVSGDLPNLNELYPHKGG